MTTAVHTGDDEEAGASGLERWASVAGLMPLLISLCLHLSSLLLLVVWLAPGRELASSTEPERQTDIVVFKTNANQQVEYLSDEPATDNAPAPSAAARGVPSPVDALPAESASELPATVQLPTTTGIGLPETGFLPGIDGVASANRNLPSGVNEAAILAEDARGRGQGEDKTGTSGNLSIFGAPARGRTFAMLIDRSASMGDQGLGAIRSAANEFAEQLQSLNEQQRVQLITYHAAPAQLAAHWLPATDQNKQKLVDHLLGLPAFGSTNHTAALVTALKLRPEVIFLLTDGDDPGMDNGQLRIVREQARGRTTIHTVHFGRGAQGVGDSNHFMRRLASDNGGNYVYVDVDKLK